VGNEENRYPPPDSNKMMINVTKEPSDSYKKKPSKEKSQRNSQRRHLT
jgi:hypothetical protein